LPGGRIKICDNPNWLDRDSCPSPGRQCLLGVVLASCWWWSAH